MDKKLLVTIIGISLLIIGAISYVVLTPKQAESPVAPTTTNQAVDPADVDPVAPNTRDGIYTDYSKETLLATAGTKLLFFHAPWCPQCRDIEESIETDGVPSGVTVFKIDYDTNQALRQEYGVTQQTTFVKVDDQGNKLASYVAYDEPQFSSVERELLK